VPVTITFGNSPAPPPATDPNVGYRPTSSPRGPVHNRVYGPLPGICLHADQADLRGGRLQFDVAVNRALARWCELQTPILDENNAGGLYWCVHNWGFRSGGPTGCSQPDPMTMMDVPIDCGKLRLCQPAAPARAPRRVAPPTWRRASTSTWRSCHRGRTEHPRLDQELHNVHLTSNEPKRTFGPLPSFSRSSES